VSCGSVRLARRRRAMAQAGERQAVEPQAVERHAAAGQAGPRVGFIGLGNIGLPMAKRLPAAGLATTVADLVPERVQEAVAAGAQAAATPRELAAASEVIGVCVRDDADVRAVLLGADGVLAGAARDAVVAIHST